MILTSKFQFQTDFSTINGGSHSNLPVLRYQDEKLGIWKVLAGLGAAWERHAN